MPKPEKKEDILKAALQLFAERGFHGTPMSLIAEQAAVGAGTIYRYFHGKDVLIRELHQGLEATLLDHIRQGYDASLSVQDRFVHLGQALFRYFIAFPLEFRYLEQFHYSPYGTEHHRATLSDEHGNTNDFIDILDQGLAQGLIKDLPRPVLFALAFGPIVALARDHILGFVQLDDHLIRLAVEACWDGLRKSPPSGPTTWP